MHLQPYPDWYLFHVDGATPLRLLTDDGHADPSLSKRWPHPFEHESGDDKWSAAGLNAVQRCPRRRAGVACDERTTDAVGISC